MWNSTQLSEILGISSTMMDFIGTGGIPKKILLRLASPPRHIFWLDFLANFNLTAFQNKWNSENKSQMEPKNHPMFKRKIIWTKPSCLVFLLIFRGVVLVPWWFLGQFSGRTVDGQKSCTTWDATNDFDSGENPWKTNTKTNIRGIQRLQDFLHYQPPIVKSLMNLCSDYQKICESKLLFSLWQSGSRRRKHSFPHVEGGSQPFIITWKNLFQHFKALRGEYLPRQQQASILTWWLDNDDYISDICIYIYT